MEPLRAGTAHRGDLRAAEAGELLLAHRARADPRGWLRHDPRRPGHGQERGAAPAGRSPVQATRGDRGRHQPSAEQPGRPVPRTGRHLCRAAAPAQPLGRLQGFARTLAGAPGRRSSSGAAGRRGAGDEPGACASCACGQRALRLQPLLCVVLAGTPPDREAAPRGADPAGQPHPHPAGTEHASARSSSRVWGTCWLAPAMPA